jgi:hypothetical protein
MLDMVDWPRQYSEAKRKMIINISHYWIVLAAYPNITSKLPRLMHKLRDQRVMKDGQVEIPECKGKLSGFQGQ